MKALPCWGFLGCDSVTNTRLTKSFLVLVPVVIPTVLPAPAATVMFQLGTEPSSIITGVLLPGGAGALRAWLKLRTVLRLAALSRASLLY